MGAEADIEDFGQVDEKQTYVAEDINLDEVEGRQAWIDDDILEQIDDEWDEDYEVNNV